MLEEVGGGVGEGRGVGLPGVHDLEEDFGDFVVLFDELFVQ